ncbi:hypothetical protein EDD16DRAFT_1646703 [Pisolithus croceorrhizus]|nr:hypothetical protein EDD16DRAFT_1646703 [Pisolithus croceorrhizus]
MQFRAESLASCRRASPRRHLPDDIRDVACAFVVAELFGFLCLSRVTRSGSCVSLTLASRLSLFGMVVLLAYGYPVIPVSSLRARWLWRYKSFCVWKGYEASWRISRD